MTLMMRSIHVLVFLASYCLLYGEVAAEKKQCSGTNWKYSRSASSAMHLQKLARQYTGCTIIKGNLEISGLSGNADLSFLKDIEIVTGYVLIAINQFAYLPLEKLKIIRGQDLLNGVDALQIALNYEAGQPAVGLQRIGLRSLSEIQRGNINIFGNQRLCYVNSIDWLDMLGSEWQATINNTLDPQLQCPPCHESCNGHCWGPSADECQKRTKSICHQSCGKLRCSGPGPNQCCHSECAGGCTGPTNADCFVCRNVNDGGICLAACPQQKYTYDKRNSVYVRDPNNVDKYFLDGDCVDECPERYLIQDNECVKHCRLGTHSDMSRKCVPCEGNACQRECYGIGNPDGPMANDVTIHSKNIKHFEGCTIVRGNIIFQVTAFSGDPYMNIPPLTKEQLIKSFSSIQFITGYLQILGWHPSLRDFSAFGSLSTIRGAELFRGIAALVIQDNTIPSGPFHLDQIQNLGFKSLTSIDYGNVYVGYMENLCYLHSVNWSSILKYPTRRANFVNGTLFRHNKACTNDTCHPSCDEDGCWGPGDENCVRCKYYSQNDRCVQQCDSGFYQSGTTCLPCHSACESCTGSGPDQCTRCKYFHFQGVCVNYRPDQKCSYSMLSHCMPCSDFLTKHKADRDGIVPK